MFIAPLTPEGHPAPLTPFDTWVVMCRTIIPYPWHMPRSLEEYRARLLLVRDGWGNSVEISAGDVAFAVELADPKNTESLLRYPHSRMEEFLRRVENA